MKIQIYSDIHNEFGYLTPAKSDTDVVILAGDIDNGDKGVRWALEYFPDKPVIYVLGNHEYYGESMIELRQRLKEITEETNIHVLENESISIDGVRFLGCTLWTDFNLFGNSISAMPDAKEKMSDYRAIQTGESNKMLQPEDTVQFHKKSLAWLKTELNKSYEGKTVIVTHHAPSFQSIGDDRKDYFLNPAYASHLDNFVAESGAQLWVHGHIHNNSDYMVGNTRVVCNPRGYTPYELNKKFEAIFVVDI